MAQVWDQVQVIKEGDSRFGEAGVVVGLKGDQVAVKFDTDGTTLTYAATDLKHLGR